MERLRNKVDECKYKETNRLLIQQFINWLNDDIMIEEMTRGLTAINIMSTVARSQVLRWPKWIEAQRPQTAMLDKLKETRDFNAIKKSRSKTYPTKYRQCQ